MLEQVLYTPEHSYRRAELKNLSVISLYTGPIGGRGSGFKIGAAPFSVQKSIELGDFEVLERFRAGPHEGYGQNHVNLEYLIPGITKPFINLHIKLNDKD